MKRYLFAALLSVASCDQAMLVAHAADMPVKARAVPALPLFYGGSGTYCGVEMGNQQTKVGTAATNAIASSNIYAAGGTVSLTCGYTRAIGPDRWAAFDVSVNASNADASTLIGTNTVNVSRKYSVDLTAMYGAPSSVLSGIFSNAVTAFGALPEAPCNSPNPADCTNRSVHPFILGGLHYGRSVTEIADATVPGLIVLEEKSNKLRFDAGVGALVQMTTSTVWRTTARWTFGGQDRGAGFLFVPGAQIKDGGTLTVKTGLIYALSFGN